MPTPMSSAARRPSTGFLTRLARITSILVASLAAFATIASAASATLPTGFVDEPMAGSLDEPVGLARIPDGPGVPGSRIVFVEQRTARVRLIVGGSVFTVGTVPGVSSVDNERGLLGVAVDPRWPAMPYLYIHCTDGRVGHRVAISRFTLTGDLAYSGNGQLQFNAATRRDLLTALPDNATNHNGGTVRFGPDGNLYVSLGDDATGCPAQDVTVPVGKILRLDVTRLPSTAGGPGPYALLIPPGNPFPSLSDSNSKLVWAFGLRNPFRFQIDPTNGALLISDVGENTWEELDLGSTGGIDYGWPVREGPAAFGSCSGVTTPLTSPIYSYDHNDGVVIIAAGIYHNVATGFGPAYEGDAFALDYYSGFMRRLHKSGATWAIAASVPGQPSSTDWASGLENVSDALVTPDGALWYCRQSVNFNASTGEIRRIRSTNGSVSVSPGIVSRLSFAPPAPTPSRGAVQFAWVQPRVAPVSLSVLDASGRLVRALESGATFEAGSHRHEWDGRDESGAEAAAGLYFARLRVGDELKSVRITLLR